MFQTLGAKVTLVQLEDYRNKRVIDVIKKNDIMFVAGGSSGYLLYWMRRCEIDKHIHEILLGITLVDHIIISDKEFQAMNL